MVRTAGFHPVNRGSIPRISTIFCRASYSDKKQIQIVYLPHKITYLIGANQKGYFLYNQFIRNAYQRRSQSLHRRSSMRGNRRQCFSTG